MTDIDIERLRRAAMIAGPFFGHTEKCLYEHMDCAVLALIEQLEQVQKESDLRYQRMTYEAEQHAKVNVALADAEAERDKAMEVCQEAVSALGDVEDELEKAEAQRDRLKEAANAVLLSTVGTHDHWDSTMKRGRGCKSCIDQRAVLEKVRNALYDGEQDR